MNHRRLSNGPIENINSQIKTIMKSTNGYKEFERLRRRIFYTLNRDTPIKWLILVSCGDKKTQKVHVDFLCLFYAQP